MRNRGILIALGVFAVVLLVFLLIDFNKPPASPTATPSPQAAPIINIAASRVNQIVINAKGQVLTFKRTGSNWTFSLCPKDQTACPDQPADATKAVAIIDALTALRPSRTVFGAPEGLPAYGLDTPSGGEVELRGIGGEDLDLFIGAKSPDGSSYFVRLKTKNDIHAVPTTTIDTQILNAVDTPPVPPSPTPAPAASPSAAVSPT